MARPKFGRIVDYVIGSASIIIGAYFLITEWPNNIVWPLILIAGGIFEILFDTKKLIDGMQKWILRLNVKRDR